MPSSRCAEGIALIDSVNMYNFLSHGETNIELEEGVNVFIGNNGTGKSSVIDAITYALFGMHTRESDKDLVRRGSSSAMASVTIDVGGNKYRVERRLDSTGRLISAILREVQPRDALIVAGERRQMGESVSERVSKILGLDYERLRVAAIIQQGELDSLLRYRPAEFKELIDSIIGIERLDEAYKNMKDAIELFRERLRNECMGKYDDRNYQQLVADIESTNARLEETKRRASEAGAGAEAARKELEKLKGELERLVPMREARMKADEIKRSLEGYVAKRLKEMSQRAEELERKARTARRYIALASGLEDAKAKLEATENEAEKARESIEALAAEASEYRNLSERLKSIEHELNSYIKAKEDLERTILEYETEVEKLRAIPPPQVHGDVEDELQRLRKMKDEALEQRGSLRRKIDDYELIAESGRCPTCGSDAKAINIYEKINTTRLQLSKLEDEIKAYDDKIKRLEAVVAEVHKHEETIKRLELLEKSIADYRAKVEQAGRRIEELKTEMAEKSKRAEQIKDAPNKLNRAREEFARIAQNIKELQKNVEEMKFAWSWLKDNAITSEDDIKKLEAEMSGLLEAVKHASSPRSVNDLAIDEYAQALIKQLAEQEERSKGYSEEEYNRVQSALDKAKETLDRFETSRTHYETEAAELEAELKSLNEARAKVEEAARYINELERIREDVFNRDGAVATSFRSWAIREISLYASEHIRRFGIGITEVKLEESRRSASIRCFTGNGEVPVESLSGGEKVAVALALRFGMARLMGTGNIDFIVLDEPTVYLDEERKKTLVSIISGFSAGQGPIRQMIIITHDREIFEEASVDAIFKFEKVNGVTRVLKE